MDIIKFKRNRAPFRILSLFVLFTFVTGYVFPPSASAQAITSLGLPALGSILAPTPAFTPTIIRGIMVHPEDALKFDFIIDKGDSNLIGDKFQAEANKLVKYFLASLTVPEKEMWVNLSPYEKDRIIPGNFGDTEMGRDLLAQDYILKQMTASLMMPDSAAGDSFWKRVRARAKKEFGSEDVALNTFNKIWIVPEKVNIFENEKGAYIVDSRLKVMLEEDYVALEANKNSTKHGLGSVKAEDLKPLTDMQKQVIKEIIIPEIEKEVNEGKTFANLRQIYHSMILASWYKKALKESLLGQLYVDKSKTEGVEAEDKTVVEQIYNQYVEAFKKGVYELIKEEYDPATQAVIPRKYFSGGVALGSVSQAMLSRVSMPNMTAPKDIVLLETAIVQSGPAGVNRAMLAKDEQSVKGDLLKQIEASKGSAEVGERLLSELVTAALELRNGNLDFRIVYTPEISHEENTGLLLDQPYDGGIPSQKQQMLKIVDASEEFQVVQADKWTEAVNDKIAELTAEIEDLRNPSSTGDWRYAFESRRINSFRIGAKTRQLQALQEQLSSSSTQSGALKNLGLDKHYEGIPFESVGAWISQSRNKTVSDITIRTTNGVETKYRAKVVVDPNMGTNLGIQAYHFRTGGDLVIVTPRPISQSDRGIQEAVYHEIQEDSILQNFPNISVRDAHILAAAEEARAFHSTNAIGLMQVTPYHRTQIATMSNDQLLDLLGEDRSYQLGVVYDHFGDEALEMAIQYEAAFKYHVMQTLQDRQIAYEQEVFRNQIDNELIAQLLNVFGLDAQMKTNPQLVIIIETAANFADYMGRQDESLIRPYLNEMQRENVFRVAPDFEYIFKQPEFSRAQVDAILRDFQSSAFVDLNIKTGVKEQLARMASTSLYTMAEIMDKTASQPQFKGSRVLAFLLLVGVLIGLINYNSTPEVAFQPTTPVEVVDRDRSDEITIEEDDVEQLSNRRLSNEVVIQYNRNAATIFTQIFISYTLGHTVRPGESVSLVTGWFYGSNKSQRDKHLADMTEVLEASGLKVPQNWRHHTIAPGQELTIPSGMVLKVQGVNGYAAARLVYGKNGHDYRVRGYGNHSKADMTLVGEYSVPTTVEEVRTMLKANQGKIPAGVSIVAGPSVEQILDIDDTDKSNKAMLGDKAMKAEDLEFPIFASFQLSVQLGNVQEKMARYSEPAITYRTTMMNLELLFDTDQALFNELIRRVASNPADRVLFSEDREKQRKLQSLGVLYDGSAEMPYALKAIVEAVAEYKKVDNANSAMLGDSALLSNKEIQTKIRDNEFFFADNSRPTAVHYYDAGLEFAREIKQDVVDSRVRVDSTTTRLLVTKLRRLVSAFAEEQDFFFSAHDREKGIETIQTVVDVLKLIDQKHPDHVLGFRTNARLHYMNWRLDRFFKKLQVDEEGTRQKLTPIMQALRGISYRGKWVLNEALSDGRLQDGFSFTQADRLVTKYTGVDRNTDADMRALIAYFEQIGRIQKRADGLYDIVSGDRAMTVNNSQIPQRLVTVATDALDEVAPRVLGEGFLLSEDDLPLPENMRLKGALGEQLDTAMLTEQFEEVLATLRETGAADYKILSLSNGLWAVGVGAALYGLFSVVDRYIPGLGYGVGILLSIPLITNISQSRKKKSFLKIQAALSTLQSGETLPLSTISAQVLQPVDEFLGVLIKTPPRYRDPEDEALIGSLRKIKAMLRHLESWKDGKPQFTFNSREQAVLDWLREETKGDQRKIVVITDDIQARLNGLSKNDIADILFNTFGMTEVTGPDIEYAFRSFVDPEGDVATGSANQAMLGAEQNNDFTKGGIDFNPETMNMQIQRDGSGVPLPMNLQPIESLRNIRGFQPVIINVTPITNLPLLLGVNAPAKPSITTAQI